MRKTDVILKQFILIFFFTSAIAFSQDFETKWGGLNKTQPIGIGDKVYLETLVSRCPDTCPGTEKIFYTYKGVYKGANTNNIILEQMTEDLNSNGIVQNKSVSNKTIPLDDKFRALDRIGFKEFFFTVADNKGSLIVKKAILLGGFGLNFFTWDYDNKNAQFLSDNDIRVPKEGERLTLIYDLKDIAKDKILIKLQWFYTPGVIHGNDPNFKMIELPVNSDGYAVLNTPDGKSLYLTTMDGVSVKYPLFLVMDNSDEFARFWKKDLQINLVNPVHDLSELKS